MIIDLTQIAGRQVLAGVPFGRRVLGELLAKVEAEPTAPTALALDFQNVEAATASFLREAVVGFCQALRARRSRYYLIVANASDAVIDDLRLLAERGKPLLTCRAASDGRLGEPLVVGDIDPKQRVAFDLVRRLGEADAREVCTASGECDERSPIPTYWNNRLAALVDQGLLMELPQGRSKRYRPVLEEDRLHG